MSVPVEEIDLSELSSTGTLLQTALWASFKSDFGWDAHAFRPAVGPWSGEKILVLCRHLAPGLRLAYVPYAPTQPVTPVTGALSDLGAAIAAGLSAPPVCVRFDLQWAAGSIEKGRADPIRKAALDVQPPSTVIIDLNQESDELLAAMHRKNRYNIRLSERRGVAVRAAGPDELGRWYAVYRETAVRDRISIHPLRYYSRLFELAGDSIDFNLHLYLAEHDGDLLAGIIVAELGGQATYLYGASSNQKRDLMPNYALQWAAISHARDAGLATYDLFGVPPADDPAHPMHGLFRFKTGFGGALVHRAGSWDAVTQPIRYNAYSFAERARSFYFHRMRKAGAR